MADKDTKGTTQQQPNNQNVIRTQPVVQQQPMMSQPQNRGMVQQYSNPAMMGMGGYQQTMYMNPGMGMGMMGQPGMMMGQPGMMMGQPGMMMGQPGMMMGQPGMMMIQNFIPGPIEGVPPGLEVLHLTENLFIRQTVEIAEFLYNAPNKYEVLDTWGRRIYFAVETTSFMDLNCTCGPPPFKVSVLNFVGNEALHMEGSPGCCCDGTCVVTCSSGLCGRVDDASSCDWCPEFDVKGPTNVSAFKIEGPCCAHDTCGGAEFPVLQNGQPVGRISKQWSGLVQEIYTTADNYGISFPANTDVRLKATLLGAALMIDFKYFEHKADDHHHHHGHHHHHHHRDLFM